MYLVVIPTLKYSSTVVIHRIRYDVSSAKSDFAHTIFLGAGGGTVRWAGQTNMSPSSKYGTKAKTNAESLYVLITIVEGRRSPIPADFE